MNSPRSLFQKARFWVAVALLGYVGSYLVLVEARARGGSGIGPWPNEPRYLIGEPVTTGFYAPVQKLDAIVRPRYWNFYGWKTEGG